MTPKNKNKKTVRIFLLSLGAILPFLKAYRISGNPALIENFPYQVHLSINDSLWQCGGSIIGKKFVLTAAHCIYGIPKNVIKIRAGSADRTRGGQVVGIEHVTYPENRFNIDTYDYDIAILELTRELNWEMGVAPIALPPPVDNDYNIDGAVAIATGWGQIDPDVTVLPIILQYVELPIIDTRRCAQRYYDGNLITSRMFCAGYQNGGKDTCMGDSGGPLALDGVLVGVTSWGAERCADSQHPSVFTKVAYFRYYIDTVIQQSIQK